MTTLTLPDRSPETARGRNPVHTTFLARLAKAKLGQKIPVDIPKSVPLRGGGVAKGDEAAMTVRARMNTTVNYHFRAQAIKQGVRIKSSLQDGKLVFWKEEGTPRKRRTVHETTSKRVAATAAKILKNPRSSKAAKTVAASALTQAAPKTVAKRKKKAGKTRKAAKK